MNLTDRLLGPILRDDPARPLITYYDDADGSRVELSAATIANWGAKTANWLLDECGLEPGDRVHVALPAHWQTAGALLGAWWCGAEVVADPDGAAVSLVAPAGALAGTLTDSAAPEVRAVVALDPLGRGMADPPEGCVDWSSEIRVHGDFFPQVDPLPGDAPALFGATVDQVASSAAARAVDLGIGPGDRVLSTADWTTPAGLTDGLLAVLAARASLVYYANLDADPATLESRTAQEKITIFLTADR